MGVSGSDRLGVAAWVCGPLAGAPQKGLLAWAGRAAERSYAATSGVGSFLLRHPLFGISLTLL